MALGSSQPLTEMSTRNVSKGETELQNISYREGGRFHDLKRNSFQHPNKSSAREMLKKIKDNWSCTTCTKNKIADTRLCNKCQKHPHEGCTDTNVKF
jgi:hypothetical protein